MSDTRGHICRACGVQGLPHDPLCWHKETLDRAIRVDRAKLAGLIGDYLDGMGCWYDTENKVTMIDEARDVLSKELINLIRTTPIGDGDD